ncbi:ABC transporter permease [Zooshikella marina]|uniref:ABC transporter permease n=1 Tax=Zooshikella ganghwensis TaxID=202772 RepID=A0A4P9VMY3_9GAMM|nr:ABC transporter permease [Zooshikella ganghwensis]MBU2707618.1 ABC transporter permease [Zooshikella ganghwensis]RDH44733.1 ABC transporter permease [Zooshikella ganghwensis]
MIIFLLKRLLQAVVVMFIISLIGFTIKDSLGDPVREMVGESVSEEEREALREKLGLNDPFIVQYGRFLKGAVQGDLGQSYFYKKPVTDVILSKLPATLELVFGATLIIIFFSVPLGVYCAIKPRSWLTKFIMGASIVGISVPVFLTGIFLMFIFGVILDYLPVFGRGELISVWGPWETGLFTLDGLAHLILPSITLSSLMLPLFIRLIRSEMTEVLHSEYIKFAWAKGLDKYRIWFRLALKNTMLPVITVGGVQIGTMVAYTILTETVFQWPGMGFMFLEAINRSDTPLIIGYLVFVGLIFVITNTLVDLIYGFIDPTIKVAGGK